MSIDIFYLKQKFRSKELNFNELLNIMGTEPETMSLNSMEILADFDKEINDVDREYLINLIKLDEHACKGFLQRCKERPGERQGVLDVLIEKSCYRSLVSVVGRKDEVVYILKKIKRPLESNINYIDLVASIFNYYMIMSDEEPYRKRIFKELVNRPDIIKDLITDVYYRYYYNSKNFTFTNEEIAEIYKKNGKILIDENMNFDGYFNMCIAMFMYITDENREILVYKALEERKVDEAKNMLYLKNYKPILRLNGNMRDLLDSFIIMEELAG